MAGCFPCSGWIPTPLLHCKLTVRGRLPLRKLINQPAAPQWQYSCTRPTHALRELPRAAWAPTFTGQGFGIGHYVPGGAAGVDRPRIFVKPPGAAGDRTRPCVSVLILARLRPPRRCDCARLPGVTAPPPCRVFIFVPPPLPAPCTCCHAALARAACLCCLVHSPVSLTRTALPALPALQQWRRRRWWRWWRWW